PAPQRFGTREKLTGFARQELPTTDQDGAICPRAKPRSARGNSTPGSSPSAPGGRPVSPRTRLTLGDSACYAPLGADDGKPTRAPCADDIVSPLPCQIVFFAWVSDPVTL